MNYSIRERNEIDDLLLIILFIVFFEMKKARNIFELSKSIIQNFK